jgi:hypothetical protein
LVLEIGVEEFLPVSRFPGRVLHDRFDELRMRLVLTYTLHTVDTTPGSDVMHVRGLLLPPLYVKK